MDPLLRFNKHKRVPRSAERGQRLCLWTPPPLKRRAKLSDALRAEKCGEVFMKIICFGDSNTWGYDPRSYLGERYPKDVR